MRKQAMNFVRDGLIIRGWMYLPDEEKEKYPLVIGAHGFNGTPMKQERYAAKFCPAGFATVIFDFCGGGTRLSSDGDCLDMSIMTEVADMEVVFESVRKLDYIDDGRIYLLGESMGGAVSALMASRHPDEIKSICLLYPGLMLPEKFRAIYPDRSMIPDKVFHFAMDVGRRYFEDVYDMDMWEEIKKYERPVYIIHGDADEAVPVEVTYKAKTIYKDCRITIVPGMKHGIIGDELNWTADRFAEFLLEQEK